MATLKKLDQGVLAKTQAELAKEKKRADIAENDKLDISRKLAEAQGQLDQEKARDSAALIAAVSDGEKHGK